MDNKCHEVLEQKMCKELEQLQAKYAANPAQQMTPQDLEMIDKLYHALKSMATYTAMKEAEEYEAGGMSGRRGRAANGRYISRDMDHPQSYSDGYAEGYSEAMNQMNGGNSGHYPMIGGYPPRWR